MIYTSNAIVLKYTGLLILVHTAHPYMNVIKTICFSSSPLAVQNYKYANNTKKICIYRYLIIDKYSVLRSISPHCEVKKQKTVI